MRAFFTKPIIVTILALSILGVGVFVGLHKKTPETPLIKPSGKSTDLGSKYKVIGTSVEGRKIETYTYGSGKRRIVFAGGMHGGYEWNSVLLAYQFIDYLDKTPGAIPENVSITIIPSINPDGVYKVVGKEGRFSIKDVSTNKEILASGRFNAHGVDLNRNFDCNWKPTSTWQTKTVSAGSKPFSEPEAIVIRSFVLENKPVAVIFWHSQANAVYASECNKGILPQTLDIMNAYSRASGYLAVKTFDSYKVTGDSEGWLASIGIPAITVELKNHETIEWEQNLAGIKALFKYYSQKTGVAQ